MFVLSSDELELPLLSDSNDFESHLECGDDGLQDEDPIDSDMAASGTDLILLELLCPCSSSAASVSSAGQLRLLE